MPVFRSLRTRNYRLFFVGQLLSNVGSWMQSTALAWLVVRLTSSGLAVGLVLALQFGPMLLGSWGGLVADRFPKRKILLVTQTLFLVQATVLATLTATGVVRVWMVYGLALAAGIVQIFDVPTRQSFVSELVAKDDVMNAVSLNNTLANIARVAGPAIAGVVIAKIGIAVCFFANTVSYIAVLAAIVLMREGELHRHSAVAKRGKRQIRAGWRYIASTPDLLLPILLMAVLGSLGFNFMITLPLLARFTFDSGPTGYGALSSALAFGNICGALYAASRREPSRRLLIAAAIAFGVTTTTAAFAPSLAIACAVLMSVGVAGQLFVTTTNSTLQVTSSPEMRGRVMAVFLLLFLGSAPFGGPLMGWISQTWSPRAALAVGGVASLCAGLVAIPAALRRGEARHANIAVVPAAEPA